MERDMKKALNHFLVVGGIKILDSIAGSIFWDSTVRIKNWAKVAKKVGLTALVMGNRE